MRTFQYYGGGGGITTTNQVVTFLWAWTGVSSTPGKLRIGSAFKVCRIPLPGTGEPGAS
ncbi:MAG TPA: hypothetical protein VK501_23900 [Baekduia sp.]|uniref:hypothetical protein n=1 Tax=Baekduia sp. TaxID=2600305 RepID=UPI002BA36B16|nr:hypothetical protein [Baekduia sp.]HMJ36971.1 hypothetical protein [Baekduia sp.]